MARAQPMHWAKRSDRFMGGAEPPLVRACARYRDHRTAAEEARVTENPAEITCRTKTCNDVLIAHDLRMATAALEDTTRRPGGYRIARAMVAARIQIPAGDPHALLSVTGPGAVVHGTFSVDPNTAERAATEFDALAEGARAAAAIWLDRAYAAAWVAGAFVNPQLDPIALRRAIAVAVK